jgi:hypothetical protein
MRRPVVRGTRLSVRPPGRRLSVAVGRRRLQRGLRGSLLAVVLATTPALLRGQAAAPVARTDAAVARVLAAPTDLEAVNLPLVDFVTTVSERYGLAIRLDPNGLRRAGVLASTKVTASFRQVPLGLALKQVLQPLKLQHRVVDGLVVIDDVGLPLDDARPRGNAPFEPQRIEVQVAPLQQPRVRIVRPAVIRNGNFNDPESVRTQLRLILHVELKVVKSVCSPTPAQLEELKQEALAQIAGEDYRLERRDRLQEILHNARLIVAERLIDLARSRLSADQVRRYEREVKKRTENLRQVCARNMVVALDEELSLSESQRQKICAELAANWNDAWTISAVFAATSVYTMLPNLPDELVVPYLDASQRAIWDDLSKQDTRVFPMRTSAFLGMAPPAPDQEE